MRNIFKELYNGEISPETKEYIHDTAYKDAVRVKIGFLNKLTETLGEPEKELLEKYSEARMEEDSIINYYAFSYALRLGILLNG